MNNFNFYFEVKRDKKVIFNQEKNLVEIALNDLGQGMLFSPQEFQETRLQSLTLPGHPQVRKSLLENDITNKRLVVKEIPREPTLTNINEKTLKLVIDTFGAVEIVNSENENPFDPLVVEWDKWGEKKEGWKSWMMWWNPRNMKFWDPPLIPEEQEKFLASKGHSRQKAWEIYRDRLNHQNRKIDLSFQVNTIDKSHTTSGFDCDYRERQEINIFSWPPFNPPLEIKELIPNGSPRIEEMDNLVIGRIDLVFDNQDTKNRQLFRQWENLLTETNPNKKFVLRNIPLQIKENWYALDNFLDFHKLDWQNWHRKGDEEPQWEETQNADFMRKAIYRGKKVRAIQIGTKGLEEQLKLENYRKRSNDKNNNKDFSWTPWLIGGGLLVLVVILFFVIRKKYVK